MELLISTLEQGMIYGIMALGVYITYKILDFPDLTVDGSFPLGAAVTAVMITNGIPAALALPASFLAGAAAGALTGLIHVKLKVKDLLSGIIMMTALYTVNLRIAGRANLPFYKKPTVFDNGVVNGILGQTGVWQTAAVMLVIVLAVKLVLDWYLKTGSGFLLRAVGDNPSIVTAMENKDPRAFGGERSGGAVGQPVCTAAAVFRDLFGNRGGCDRACQRHHRHKPLSEAGKHRENVKVPVPGQDRNADAERAGRLGFI